MSLDRLHAILSDLVFILDRISANRTIIETLKVCIETTSTHGMSTTEVDCCPGTLEAYGTPVIMIRGCIVIKVRFGHAIFATELPLVSLGVSSRENIPAFEKLFFFYVKQNKELSGFYVCDAQEAVSPS